MWGGGWGNWIILIHRYVVSARITQNVSKGRPCFITREVSSRERKLKEGLRTSNNKNMLHYNFCTAW